MTTTDSLYVKAKDIPEDLQIEWDDGSKVAVKDATLVELSWYLQFGSFWNNWHGILDSRDYNYDPEENIANVPRNVLDAAVLRELHRRGIKIKKEQME